MRTRTLRSLIYFTAGIGLIVAIFTFAETLDASLQSICTVNAFVSCAAVAKSGKTSLFGISDSFYGIGGFILIFIVAAIAESRKREMRWGYLLLLLTTVGVGLSVYFAYVQIAEIGALCPVCATGWVLGWITWAATILLVLRMRAKARARAEDRTASTAERPSDSASSNSS